MLNTAVPQSGSKLSIGNIGAGGEAQLSAESLDRIIASAQLSPVHDHMTIRFCLSEQINFWVRGGFEHRLELSDFRQMKKLFGAVRRYTILTRKNKNAYYPPSPPPGKWLAQSHQWFEDMQQHFDSGSENGRPRQVWGLNFYSTALGLFAAIFNVVPTSSVRGDGRIDGAFARFLRTLFQEVLAVVSTDKKLLRFWQIPTDASLSKKISNGLKLPAAHPDCLILDERPSELPPFPPKRWQQHRIFLEQAFLKRGVEETGPESIDLNP